MNEASMLDGSSPTSWQEAAANAVAAAKQILPAARTATIVKLWAEVDPSADGAITTYFATVLVSE